MRMPFRAALGLIAVSAMIPAASSAVDCVDYATHVRLDATLEIRGNPLQDIVVVRSGLVYVADESAGVHLVEVSDPEAPVLSATIAMPDDAMAIAVDDQPVYTAVDQEGLVLMPLHCESTVSVAEYGIVRQDRLSGSPNPFRGRTEIGCSLGSLRTIDIDIYDVSGRIVRELVSDRASSPGSHRLVWAGRDSRGWEVSAGVYFGRLTMNGRVDHQQIVVIRQTDPRRKSCLAALFLSCC